MYFLCGGQNHAGIMWSHFLVPIEYFTNSAESEQLEIENQEVMGGKAIVEKIPQIRWINDQ